MNNDEKANGLGKIPLFPQISKKAPLNARLFY